MAVRTTFVGHVLLMRSLQLVFEERLRKDTSDGSDLTGITIKFAFAAQQPEGIDADRLQATAAVNQAMQVIGTLDSTPATAGLLAVAVDTGTTVVAEVQTFQTTCGVLLHRLELFDKIVTDITSVIDVHLLASLAHSLTDSSVCVIGLVCYISREQSLSVSHNSCCP